MSNFEKSIATLVKVITDYHDGLAMIDREFDQACEKVNHSISNIGGTPVKHSNDEFSKERSLRQQARQIEKQIAKSNDKITKLDQAIITVNKEIQSTTQKKADFEQQIENRWLIEKIYYFFAEDNARQQCDRLQGVLYKQSADRSELEKTKLDFKNNRQSALSEKESLQKRLDSIRQQLSALRKSSAELEKRRQSRRKNLQTGLPANWRKATQEIEFASKQTLQQQPPFENIKETDAGIVSQIPNALILGRQMASFNDLSCSVPHEVPFPFERSLILPEENQAQRRLAHHLLLRLTQSIPPGKLELMLVDPLKQGDSFAPFLPLLQVEQLMPQQRVLTRADEIEALLGSMADEVEEMIQNRFKGRISDWMGFNAANQDNALPYRVLLLFDVPEQLSDKSSWYLERLIENGPRCGILPIVAVDTARIEDRRHEKLRETFSLSTQRVDTLLRVNSENTVGLSFSYHPERWPQQDALDSFLVKLAEHHAEAGRFSKSLSDLWVNYQKGATTVDGLNIPIGWTPSGDAVPLRLGASDSEHHALLAGKTGSGKSNLLHVMIHSLCEKYAPHEIDLYLLDYKESTEFTVYAKPELPHAKLVATESDPEYGVTVLQHLVEELEHRASLFKSSGVRDFPEYRNSRNCKLSRILLVIDEFQILFTESRQVADAAEKLLSQLLKQGRSFGIHILLATQTLKGINALSISSLISQLGCRIALACGQEDSAMILSGNNWAASELRSPPEGIINNSNGAKSGNVKIRIPLVEREFCLAHLKRLSQRATKRGIESKAHIFNGAHLPLRPSLNNYQHICGQSDSILLGEQLNFAADFISVPLTNRQAFNILFCGYHDQLHDGLLASLLASLSRVSSNFDEVVYFNGRGVEPADAFGEISSSRGSTFRRFDDLGEMPLESIAESIGTRRTALIIDGLDAEKALHPVQSFRAPKPGEPPTPASLLKQIAEEGSRKGTFVFAFMDNWRRCSSSCKDLLNLFELRVAFCMNEDDAGQLVSGSIGKFKGIEKPNRAVFVNRMTNEISWFRPYINGESL
ncbi:FtsK/SpoIIIE domain-containing protein [Desulfatibacillum aliphaticivorans]|uniref:FtsK/SpoIIIE domain-containing protein n=1 Tax=Desulfatibacillum aliphaticivorans TaxID=218208 RepID=UPI0003FABE0C|nr:FtsK/SpoIIIE domain-containing protein [Desulfatibacillum aliphaticivorans]